MQELPQGPQKRFLLGKKNSVPLLPFLPGHREEPILHPVERAAEQVLDPFLLFVGVLPLLPGHGELAFQHAVEGTGDDVSLVH